MMLKKSLILLSLGLIVTTAYADAPKNVFVNGNIVQEAFTIDEEQWGYQFNIETKKPMTFTITIDNSSSSAGLTVSCVHKLDHEKVYQIDPEEVYEINSLGQTAQCTTDDVIRVISTDIENGAISGHYSIVESKS